MNHSLYASRKLFSDTIFEGLPDVRFEFFSVAIAIERAEPQSRQRLLSSATTAMSSRPKTFHRRPPSSTAVRAAACRRGVEEIITSARASRARRQRVRGSGARRDVAYFRERRPRVAEALLRFHATASEAVTVACHVCRRWRVRAHWRYGDDKGRAIGAGAGAERENWKNETKINGRREKELSGTGAVMKCTSRRLQLLLHLITASRSWVWASASAGKGRFGQ